MSRTTLQLTPQLLDYLLAVTVQETDVMRRLRAETGALPMARMQISPEQGQFLGWLAGVLGARRALEVGVFTGYSALSVARALPADGRLLACDVNEEWTSIARRSWAEAGLADRIELRLAPAAETLAAELAAGRAGTFDLAFIDADKTGYDGYYEQCLALLRPGGVIAVDNTLWSGRVADPAEQDDDTVAVRALNAKVFADGRVHASLLPLGDGLLLARKL